MLLAKDAQPDAILDLIDTAWASWTPRPDDDANFDQQTAYVEARDNVSFCLGGNGCLAGDTLIYDPVDGTSIMISERKTPFHVWSRNPVTGKREIGISSPGYRKGFDNLYQVDLSNGFSFVSTGKHRVLTAANRWMHVSDLAPGMELQKAYPTNDDRLSRKRSDFQGHCSARFRQCGEPLPLASVDAQESVQQQAYVPAHNPNDWHQDVLDISQEHTSHPRCAGLLSTIRCEHQEPRFSALQSRSVCRPYSQSFEMGDIHGLYSRSNMAETRPYPTDLQSPEESNHQLHTTAASYQAAKEFELSSEILLDVGVTGSRCPHITSITPVGQGDFWDISVYPYANYELAGVIHHNSGKTAASAKKCADFVLGTQPPRKNTPFWIIGATYKQVSGVAWAEKLEGQQFIPRSEYDDKDITWYDSKLRWPLSVKLKPWPNGNNWVLEFMSYEQGRSAMQARSIGGFWFSEQFPWNLFLEVLRGCRDYMIPGGQFAEFTPIEPELCIAIEEVMDDPPPGWGFYRLNTEANRPNLADNWYESFFGAVPLEMMATRKTGALATFEGVIYQTFNPLIHVIDETSKDPWRREMCRLPWLPGSIHNRAFDWGSSIEHPMAAVFGCRNGAGDYYIYDEYWNNSQDFIIQDHAVQVMARSLSWGWPQPEYFKAPPAALQHYVEQVMKEFEAIKVGMNGSRANAEKIEGRIFGDNYADPSGTGYIRIYQNCGIPITAASNEVFTGIDEVRSLLKINPVTGRPRLLIHSRCKHLIEELRKYKWKKRRKSGIFTQEVNRPEPFKKDDDVADSLRYYVKSIARDQGIKPSSTSSKQQREDVRLDRGKAARPMEAAKQGFFVR